MKISLVQARIVDGQPIANCEHILELIRQHEPSDLYLLPELWPTGYHRDSWPEYVQKDHQQVMHDLKSLAQEQKAWIGGSYVVASDDNLVNQFILLSPSGEIAITYDKVHLFSPLEEDKNFKAGTESVQTTINSWNTHLSICYDLRFPIMYRKAAQQGAQLFLISAQWPVERCHHMVALAKARAIENQAYVALCNRIGPTTSGLTFGGFSGVWDPDGNQVADANIQEQVITAKLVIHRVEESRAQIPIL